MVKSDRLSNPNLNGAGNRLHKVRSHWQIAFENAFFQWLRTFDR